MEPEQTNKNEDLRLSSSDNEPENQDNAANEYGSVEYWENRYKQRIHERFEWLENYEALKKVIQQYLQQDFTKKILNLGCGNSKIQDDLYEVGYKNITNNDISKIVIQQMQAIKQEKQYHGMRYDVMDVTQMTYPDKYFDMIIDKSTIDAVLCSDEPYINTAKMLEHVFRILKDDGIYIIISYGDPSNRSKYLNFQHINFTVKIQKLEKQGEHGNIIHWIYICQKDLSKPCKINDKKWKQEFFKKLKEQEEEDYS